MYNAEGGCQAVINNKPTPSCRGDLCTKKEGRMYYMPETVPNPESYNISSSDVYENTSYFDVSENRSCFDPSLVSG